MKNNQRNVSIKIKYLIFTFALILNQENIFAQGKEDFIKKAINEFSKETKFLKNNSAFSVTYHDTIYHLSISKDVDGISYPIVQQIYNDLKGVSILPMDYIFFLPPGPKIGDKNFPNRIIEKDGKIFYWIDNEVALTQRIIDVFRNYSLIQIDEYNKIVYPELSTDDSKKGIDYFFCNQSIEIFKKVKTNKGIGYYLPPKITCK